MAHELMVFVGIFGGLLAVRGAESNTTDIAIQIHQPKTNATVSATIQVLPNNKTLDVETITRPLSQSPSQQVDKTVAINPKNASFKIDSKLAGGFRPSQQLEMYYEHNAVPVAPAYPEAKHVSTSYNPKPFRSDWGNPGQGSSSTQHPWSTKVQFPTTPPQLASAKDRPYPYIPSAGYPEASTKPNSFSFMGEPPYKLGNLPSTTPAQFGSVSNDHWGIFGQNPFGKESSFGSEGYGGGPIMPKTQLEYPVVESGPQHQMGMMMASPWKKIIKFLTAFIPIGLLLGALTPTVINVSTPNNMTRSRGRSETPRSFAANQLASSITFINKLNSGECEERVICELLLGAGSSKNAEQHVEDFLQAFTDQEDGDVSNRIEELKKIFHAVKNKNCEKLLCSTLKAKKNNNGSTAISIDDYTNQNT